MGGQALPYDSDRGLSGGTGFWEMQAVRAFHSSSSKKTVQGTSGVSRPKMGGQALPYDATIRSIARLSTGFPLCPAKDMGHAQPARGGRIIKFFVVNYI